MFLLTLLFGCAEECVPIGDTPGCAPIEYCCTDAECGYLVDIPGEVGDRRFGCENPPEDCSGALASALDLACFVPAE